MIDSYDRKIDTGKGIRCDGIWPGVVVDRKDPLKSCRIKVRVPQVYGGESSENKISDLDLPWALPCIPYSGNISGSAMVPENGVGVWVMFMGGDPRYPVWLGGWISTVDSGPPKHKIGYEGDPKSYVVQSPTGNTMMLSDTDNLTVGVHLEDQAGQFFSLMETDRGLETRHFGLNDHFTSLVRDFDINIGRNLKASIAGLIAILVGAAITISTEATFTLSAAALISILSTAGVYLGATTRVKYLVNELMIPLFNNHTHNYIPGLSGGAETSAPNSTASVGVHTTVETKAS